MSDITDRSVALPAELKVSKFAEARVKEILELRSSIGEFLNIKEEIIVFAVICLKLHIHNSNG